MERKLEPKVKEELTFGTNGTEPLVSPYFPFPSIPIPHMSAGLSLGLQYWPYPYQSHFNYSIGLSENNPLYSSSGYQTNKLIEGSQPPSSKIDYVDQVKQEVTLSDVSSSHDSETLPATSAHKLRRKKGELALKKERNSKEKGNRLGVSPRKKIDRFDGLPEDEVARKLLPDHITHNLDILIIGINPGLFAAYKGHHYAGPGNHFWKCLFMSGLTPEQFTAYDDFRMLEFGIGFTNMVARTTRGSSDLSRKEIVEGTEILLSKLKYYTPKIAVFNGKCIYEIFSKRKDFAFGKQPDVIDGTNTHVWVMPSSSARCSQLPRAIDKVPFYLGLKKLRDHLNGLLPDLKEEDIVFSGLKLRNYKKLEPKIEELV